MLRNIVFLEIFVNVILQIPVMSCVTVFFCVQCQLFVKLIPLSSTGAGILDVESVSTLCYPKISSRSIFIFFNAGILENAHFLLLQNKHIISINTLGMQLLPCLKCMSFLCEEKQVTEGINQFFILETWLSSKQILFGCA